MKRTLLVPAVSGVVVLVLVALAAGCGGDGATTAAQSTTEASGGIPAPPAQLTQFGTIASLREQGGRWVMRFDPALFLSGETANVAAAQDGVIAPGEPMPNDSYTVNESKRLYTYYVAADATVTVLVRSGDQLGAKTITVAELAQIVDGTSSLALFEPLSTGVWLTYRIDTVHTIVQQYRP